MNVFQIVLVVLAVISTGVAIYFCIDKDKSNKVYSAILEYFSSATFVDFAKSLIIQAESYFVGTEKGQERLEWVCGCIYEVIPANVKPYITKSQIKTAVEVIFKAIAKKVDGHTVAVES